nr:hypothetical protein [Tanacetum cinerariifolium]
IPLGQLCHWKSLPRDCNAARIMDQKGHPAARQPVEMVTGDPAPLNACVHCLCSQAFARCGELKLLSNERLYAVMTCGFIGGR